MTNNHTEPMKVGEQIPTADDALEALDAMDDYARMDTGVDAIGPREVLRAFIQSHNGHNGHASPSPAEVGLIETRGCTCHPDDNPPVPCAKQYALHDCKQATTGLPNGWDDKILDAMAAAFLNQRHSPRRVFDGEIVGLRNDDTQIGVEFAIEQIKAMCACRALNQRQAVKEGEAAVWILRTGHGNGVHFGTTAPVEGVGWKPYFTHPAPDDQQAKDAALVTVLRKAYSVLEDKRGSQSGFWCEELMEEIDAALSATKQEEA